MSESVSLGWNCQSAMTGVSLGIRTTKLNGYQTCPFDEMITNYRGIINCISDNFAYLCDTSYIQLIRIPKESKWLNTNGNGDLIVYNSKYNFLFNHESPGHAGLYITQKWKNGIEHYIQNNYEDFISRYTRRITNFINLLNSGKHIHFILHRPNTQLSDICELVNIITIKYPNLKFDFLIFDFDKYIYYDHLILMKLDKNDDEIKRLSN